MKFKKFLALILTLALAVMLAACGGSGVTPPYAKVALGNSESAITKAYGEPDTKDDNTKGGKAYTYPCTYLDAEGTVTIGTDEKGKVAYINWNYAADSEEEYNTLTEQIKADYTKQYGDPYFENEVGTIWKGKNFGILTNTINVLGIHTITICFSDGEVQSASDAAASADSSKNTAITDPADATALYKKGETVNGSGYTLTVDSVDSTPEFDGYADADSGKEYFFASFTLENTSSEDLEVDDFFKVFADDEECSFINFYDKYYDVDAISWYSPVAAGHKIKNYFSAVVPEKWNEIKILCSDGSEVVITHADLGSISSSESSSEKTVYHIGDTLTRNGMKITLTSAQETDYVSKSSYTYYEPSDGKVFVILFFDIKNTSDITQRFNATSTFDVFIDDYSDRFTSFSFTEINNVQDLSDQNYQDILSGKSMSGYRVIEAPANWKKIELTSRQGTFEIEAKDLA